MNRIEFDKLTVIEQIEYMNSQLVDNASITSVCNSIGISDSTVRTRVKKAGYKHDKELNQYVINNKRDTEVVHAVKTSKKQDNNACTTTVINTSNDTVNEIIELSNEDIRNNLLALAKDYKDIVSMLENYKRDTAVIKQQITIDLPPADSKLVTLRVNEDILKDFNSFCDDNKQLKKVDILSQALKNFIEQHK